MTIRFPVKCEVSIYLTDGENFATASGPEVTGDVVDKAGALTAIAAAILVTERETQMHGWRLPTPKEFMEYVTQEIYGRRVAVPKQPPTWPGFTQDELDAEVRRQRVEHETRKAIGDDD